MEARYAGYGEHELWYKEAVFYEIYLRAFYDSNGDALEDHLGLTS